MKLDKKTYAYRVVLIICCMAIAALCYTRMNKSYDPLARYPYVTDENRDVILEYLDSDDINYITDQQIEPEKFMDFIKIDGFEIHNTVLYYYAKKAQDADAEYIVNFVNRYRSKLSTSTISALLTNYSYTDLITFYETESVLYEDLSLVADPTNPLLTLDNQHSVYKYAPSTLVTVGTISIQNSMQKNLTDLCEAYQKTIGTSLNIDSGYLSYENTMNRYVDLQSKYGENIEYIMNHAGQDEIQLGYTIVLDGADEWLDMCLSTNAFDKFNYESIYKNKDYNLTTIDWLKENAYRYGFVIRYPEGKEEQTGHIYQPYVLRYVGKKNAKAMYNNETCLEEAELSKLE